MYCVYRHISPSEKSYIGITCQKPERRWREGEGYRECSAFYNAIKKYGWQNIEHEILEENLSFTEACEKEKFYIAKYKSLVGENGYNLENGGRVNQKVNDETKSKISATLTGRKRKPLSLETRKKIGDANRGKKKPPKSDETRRKLSEANKGKVFSEEHCHNISEAKKGMKVGKENHRARKVLCVETGVVFDTIKDAGLFIGGSSKNIIACCRGRLNRTGGYHWEYFEEVANT